MAKIVDIADALYRSPEIDQDSNVSIASIAAWLRFPTNLGDLNNKLHTSYTVNESTLEILNENNEEIPDIAVSIYKELYLIGYYARTAKRFMGVGGVDQILEATSDGGTLRFINRNELAKSYLKLKTDSENKLKGLINDYKRNGYTPSHITGDDTNTTSTAARIGNNIVIRSP